MGWAVWSVYDLLLAFVELMDGLDAEGEYYKITLIFIFMLKFSHGKQFNFLHTHF